MTTRPVTQADVACAYRDRIAELEGATGGGTVGAGCGAGREGGRNRRESHRNAI